MGDLFESSDVAYGPFTRREHVRIDEASVVHRLCGPCIGTMVDVGAHHGGTLAKFLDDGWTVLAFEPDDDNRRILEGWIEQHPNCDLIEVSDLCVGSRRAKAVPFFKSKQSTGISGILEFHPTHVQDQVVDVVPLSPYLIERNVYDIDFLKIDTEGYEMCVLEGVDWAKHRPSIVVCEFDDEKTKRLGYTFHDLAHLLEDKGYDVWVSEWHPIVRYGVQHDWRQLRPYPCELSDENAWGNLLASANMVDKEGLVEAFAWNRHVKTRIYALKKLLTNPLTFPSIAKRQVAKWFGRK